MSSLAIEMRQGIIRLAGERSWFETRQRWLERAARIAGISTRTAKALFYCEIVDPKSSVVERVRSALRDFDREQEAKARDERSDILERIARIESRMGQTDPDFFSSQAAGLRASICDGSGVDSAVDD